MTVPVCAQAAPASTARTKAARLKAAGLGMLLSLLGWRESGRHSGRIAVSGGRSGSRRAQGARFIGHDAPMTIDLDALRRYAVARSLFTPTTLPARDRAARLRAGRPDPRAGARAGPDAAPPRARTTAPATSSGATRGWRSRRTSSSTTASCRARTQALMHPRTPRTAWPTARWAQAHAVLDFVREHGVVHPREVDAQFAHGKVTQLVRRLVATPARSCSTACTTAACCAWRGATAACACTRRASRRRRRADPRSARWTRWSTWSSRKYAPLPARIARRAGQPAAPAARRSGRGERARRWRARKRAPAARRASTASTGTGPPARTRPRAATRRTTRCACSRPSTRWSGTAAASSCFWGWAYRFEAYTPAPKRMRGYYALPLLWRDQVIGWGNLAVRRRPARRGHRLRRRRAPRDAGFRRALDDESIGVPGIDRRFLQAPRQRGQRRLRLAQQRAAPARRSRGRARTA